MLNTGAAPIGRHHFAFLRALLDGITLEHAWHSYLSFAGGPGDRRQAVQQLRQLVAAVALASGQPGCGPAVARVLPALRALPDLVRAAARRVQTGAGISGHLMGTTAAPAAPTLDDWRAAQCGSAGIDEDFYTEAEWLALYAEAFGGAAMPAAGAGNPGQVAAQACPALPALVHARAAEPRAETLGNRPSAAQRRVVLDALAVLEQCLARDARLGDATSLWLAGRVPQQLAQVGVRTLGDLVSLINLQGFRWHRRVQGLGPARAQRLLDWLVPVAEVGGQPVLETSRRPETDLVLARQRAAAAAAPGHVARAVGGAVTDAELVGAWLARHTGATRRAYARVTERFLRWLSEVRHRPLTRLGAQDLQAYLDFVRSPPADWVQQRRVRRDSPAWRPFQGPLGPRSQRHELAVLTSLLGDLHAAGQLPVHAAARLRRRLDLPVPEVAPDRSLSPAQWAFAWQVLHEKPDTPARRRLALLLALTGDAGLRLSELAAARLQAVQPDAAVPARTWQLDVVGPDGWRRSVTVTAEVQRLLSRHHEDVEAAGLSAVGPSALAPCPALASGAGEPARAGHVAQPSPGLPPLLCILRRPPPRRSLDAWGLPVLDRGLPARVAQPGPLGRSAMDKLLRRFFRDVALQAAARAGAPSADTFRTASSLWLHRRSVSGAGWRAEPHPDSAPRC